MPRRLVLGDAIDMLVSDPLGFLNESLGGDSLDTAPYTTLLLVTISTLFVAELILRFRYGTTDTQRVVTALFVYAPEVAWPLAPLLHRGVLHYAVNASVLYLAMPIESRLGRWEYLGLFVAGGCLPVYLDGAKLALLGTEPHVAAYGTSAFAFGLLGVGLVSVPSDDRKLTPRGWLILTLALGAVATIVVNLVTAITNPIILNVGHVGGLLVGLCFGYVST